MNEQNKIKTDWSMELAMLINKVFFLSKIPHKNKDWWKKDFSKDVILFLNLTWIGFFCLFQLKEYASNQYIFFGSITVVIICFIGLLISFATWTEAKQIQLINNIRSNN